MSKDRFFEMYRFEPGTSYPCLTGTWAGYDLLINRSVGMILGEDVPSCMTPWRPFKDLPEVYIKEIFDNTPLADREAIETGYAWRDNSGTVIVIEYGEVD